MKKLILALLMAVLLCLLAVPAAAATSEAIASANALYEMGLFLGTGTDANGNPNFDLDRTPTRHEAVVMLVRLLGKEAEAKAGTWTTPFTDVADWAAPYVGYAYENGLTVGTGATTFGGTNEISVSQYLTFVLRALGYENGVDFQWDKAWELSDKLGITDGQYGVNTAFTRGDVAIISEASLYVPEKGFAAYSDGLAYEINEDGKTLTITGIGTCTDTEIIIPKIIEGKKVTAIGNKAFTGDPIDNRETAGACSLITYVKIPETITSIGHVAFASCDSLMSIDIPDSVTSFGIGILGYNPNLTSIELPYGMTSIPDSMLRSCSSLTSIEIPNGVTNIEECAFYNCSNLTNIKIPNSVTCIDALALAECSKLESIYFEGTKSQWNAIVKTTGMKEYDYGGGYIEWECLDWDYETGDYTVYFEDSDDSINSADYIYLAVEDFRSIRRDYSNAEANCAYVYAYEDYNGDFCVLTFIQYRIQSTWDQFTLHNLTTGATIISPEEYYGELADYYSGSIYTASDRLRCLMLKQEVLTHKLQMVVAMIEVWSGNENTYDGVFVNAAILK